MKWASPPERSPRPPGRCTLWVTSNTTGNVTVSTTNAVIFNGPDIRWVGNERGLAGEPCWATINIGDLASGQSIVFTYDYTSTSADAGEVLGNTAAVEGAVTITASNSYSGGIGMLRGVRLVDRTFDSRDAAEDYIQEHQNKWEAALAVRYRLALQPAAKQVAEVEKVAAVLQKKEERLREANKAALDALYARKSVLVGCSDCKSRLNLAKLAEKKQARCPLCNGRLISDTAGKRVDAAVQAVEDAKLALKLIRELKPSDQTAFLIGGWCSS